MDLCKSCSGHGKVIRRVEEFIPKQKKVVETKEEKEEAIVKDYAQKIMMARQRSGLTQEDFAKNINVKLSVLRHLESGKMAPVLKLARRLEKELDIQLVEAQKTEKEEFTSDRTGEITLGDMIVIKKKKKSD